MRNQQTLVLVGMPGSGKSTVASMLGERLCLPVADLDVLLEEEEGRTISQIFEKEGEDYFRRRESKILKKVLAQSAPLVLATGGGTPCFFDNMQQIKQNAVSVYLDAAWLLLAKRLLQKPAQRPLLKDLSQADFIESLVEKFGWRISFYQQADVHIKVDAEKEVLALADEIILKTGFQQKS